MPREIDFTDPNTFTVYPRSFWVIAPFNFDRLGRVAQVSWNAYETVAVFNAGGGAFRVKMFAFNDPAVYDELLRYQLESSQQPLSFLENLENACLNIDPTFGGIPWSNVTPRYLQTVGDMSLALLFSEVGGDMLHLAGVTIKVNGSPVTIVSVDLSLNIANAIEYQLGSNLLAGDVIAWDYDGDAGGLKDERLVALPSFGPTPVINERAVLGRGSFALNGRDVVFRRTYKLAASTGFFFVDDTLSTALRKTNGLTAAQGAFALTGQAATLTVV